MFKKKLKWLSAGLALCLMLSICSISATAANAQSGTAADGAQVSGSFNVSNPVANVINVRADTVSSKTASFLQCDLAVYWTDGTANEDNETGNDTNLVSASCAEQKELSSVSCYHEYDGITGATWSAYTY